MIEELRLGARYPNFKALEAAIEKFSKETNSVYIVNHSRTVEIENKNRPISKQLPRCLKYKNIRFACKHYGKTRSNSRGLRPNQSSFKIGCPSYIYVAANTSELVVEKLVTTHSHSCDPELVSLYPERRSLANARCDGDSDKDITNNLKSVREDVLDLLSLGVERRRVLNYVWLSTGRRMFSGDLANLAKDLKDNPREVSSARADVLLERFKTMESKQKGNVIKPPNKLGALKAVKRKVPFASDTVIKTEVISNDDSSEQCYSVIETEQEEQAFDNTMYISDSMQVVSHDNINAEDIQYQYENQEGEIVEHDSNATAWSENSSLADVVKSILGPNQEGPVILHVNNYDGVAVVQVADPQTYTTSDGQVQESFPDNSHTVEAPADSCEEPQPVTRLIVKKTPSTKKPVVVTAFPEASKKTATNILKSAQLKKPSGPVENLRNEQEQNDDKFSDDGNNLSSQDDLSDTQSDHRSVLEEERTMYRVKTKKIRLQIDNLRNCIERQDLEKKKLHLEIKLLKMQVEEKESQVKQKQTKK
ncbi:Zinc finger SWIM domain-containing protein 3 [Frankliniella fusca]|uniref:Zinc finger SWIM domain-containing protein 3 n=1 Tax=Frankliniella fusca TaxID=407009 RepID=A0AAE1HF95_9NEOP|nr:Zinc finger SWIM domain-containing protein 3 [Frankliniella fusca]